jgi:hypothetical protein
LIGNVRLLKDLFREVEAFFLKTFPEKCGFFKISIFFEDFSRDIEAFSRIARLFKYILNGIEAFLKVMLGFFRNLSVAFIKTVAAEAFLLHSAPDHYPIYSHAGF